MQERDADVITQRDQTGAAGGASGPPAVAYRPYALAGLAALCAALLPLLAFSRMPLSWDGVQYVLGVLHYDLAMHQPHPPGYYLYVQLARLLRLCGLDAYTALVALTLLFSAKLTGALTWWAGRMSGRNAAIATAALCLSSPLVWACSIDLNTYIVAGAMSAVVGYNCWQVVRIGGVWVVLSGGALGIAAGLRPSTALFLAPLWGYCLWRRGGWRALLGV
ncbi:MAG TPA: hypothetical protein VM283_08215, partial [Armatimonadota bacterium]|nr:hypothetical protein [Armatimonadota bacterium]